MDPTVKEMQGPIFILSIRRGSEKLPRGNADSGVVVARLFEYCINVHGPERKTLILGLVVVDAPSAIPFSVAGES